MRTAQIYRDTLLLSKRERTVILTGAGFVRGIGIPLQDELLEEILSKDKEILRIYNFLTRQDLDRSVGIEEFLTAMDFDEVISGNSSWSSKSLSSHIAIAILGAAVSSGKVKKGTRGKFRKNAQTLLTSAKAWVTVNWDTVVETLCNTGNRKFSYFGEDNSLPLLKLHGSIDWFKMGKDNEEYIREPDFVSTFGNYYRCELFAELNSRGLFPEKIRKRDIFIDELIKLLEICAPVLVPPTHFKSFGDRFIRKIWRTAWKEMSNMEHLVIIGYSFPDSDVMMRIFLTHMICVPVFERPPRVSIINPDPNGEVAKRFAPLCVGTVNFVRSRFEDVEIRFSDQ